MAALDPVWATAAELSRAFAARTLSPVDAVEALLERIARRNPTLHAFIAVYDRDARLAAEAADRAIRAGHRVGPLHGVPIALKDLIDLEGRVTTGGSKHWADRVSPVTATVAERAIAAGMIVLGKTHTVEFAMGSWGTNTHLGAPRNPWDLEVHRTAARRAGRGWPWERGSRRWPSAPTPGARCAFPRRGAGPSGSR
jgi:aspartyl-tRNA(Asn)/glutamyl-tRNA(Gln) amidotransferase subunit A